MSHFISMNSTQLLQSSSYHDEKKPHMYLYSQQTELPPTPSSSALSFLVRDQKEEIESIDDEKEHHRLPSNKGLDTSSHQTMFTNRNYGSLSSTEFSYYQGIPTSSSSTTISPNDDDEGLYLLWTHQLLRDRGYEPSSCKLDDDEDNYSVDSSITDLSIMIEPTNSTSNAVNLITRKKESSFLSSWLSSCFPMC